MFWEDLDFLRVLRIVVDIALVWFVLYKLIGLIRGTKAVQLLKGIFVVLGMSTTLVGDLFLQYNNLIRQLGAIFIILFGLVTLGVIRPSFLMKNHQFQFSNKPSGYIGTYVIGIAFAAGWTPCIGPILASVITLSMTNPGSGMLYMSTYSVGFAIPFFTMTFFIRRMNWIKKYKNLIMKFGGILMIIFGVFLYFDWMTRITSYLVNNIFNGFMGF